MALTRDSRSQAQAASVETGCTSVTSDGSIHDGETCLIAKTPKVVLPILGGDEEIIRGGDEEIEESQNLVFEPDTSGGTSKMPSETLMLQSVFSQSYSMPLSHLKVLMFDTSNASFRLSSVDVNHVSEVHFNASADPRSGMELSSGHADSSHTRAVGLADALASSERQH